jgi:thioesterase domain-containing protein
MQDGKEISTIREAVDAAARLHPETTFLLSAESGAAISYLELKLNCIVLSSMLRAASLERGDRIAILMDNGLLTTQLLFGSIYGGLVAAPLNGRTGEIELANMLDQCDAKIVFAEEQYATLLGKALGEVRRNTRVITVGADDLRPDFQSISTVELPPDPAADDTALLTYRSNNTEMPNAVTHTHAGILTRARNAIRSRELSANGYSQLALPLYDPNSACETLIPTLMSGGSLVVTRYPSAEPLAPKVHKQSLDQCEPTRQQTMPAEKAPSEVLAVSSPDRLSAAERDQVLNEQNNTQVPLREMSIESSTLIPLRLQGTKPPLFIVQSSQMFERFRHVIEDDRPLYGLHEAENTEESAGSAENRINEYVRLIVETQPDGPYHLIGWGASAPITVEIARKLQGQGGTVALLGLIDPAHPECSNATRREPIKWNLIERLKGDHLRQQKGFRHAGKVGCFLGSLRPSAMDMWHHVVLEFCTPLSKLCARMGIKILSRTVSHPAPTRIQTPELYPGKITLFRPIESRHAPYDQSLSWRGVAIDGVEVVWIPGNHETMFVEENMEKLGHLVQEAMNKRNCCSQSQSRHRTPVLEAVPQ